MMFSTTTEASSHRHTSFAKVSIRQTLKRLGLYATLLSFRGWILYLFLNKVEDQWLQYGTKSESATETTKCWYNNGWLQPEQETCAGRLFDFSDHIVLYYAAILPIALVETIYALQYPYWASAVVDHPYSPLSSCSGKYTSYRVLPLILCASHLYLQLITAIGAFVTAAYFHTPGEVVAGFGVSLVISLPIVALQCSSNSVIASWRRFFFH